MPVNMERKKMTRQMYDTLKSHIITDRERKKQEEEEDAAQAERIRKERERKQQQLKDDQLTLDQTREQINTLDTKLNELKNQKHELFSKLKKLLHEDDSRRQRHQNEALIRNWESVNPGVFIPASSAQRVAADHAHLLQSGIKRQRSPSPPPFLYHPGAYAESTKSYQFTPGRPAYAAPAVSHAVSVASRVPPVSAFSTYPHFPGHAGMLPPQQQLPGRHHPDSRHTGIGVKSGDPGRQPLYPPYLQQPPPPASHPSLVAQHGRAGHPDADKYGIGPHVLHAMPGAPSGILPIHQPSNKPGGGIVSGYPVHPQGAPTAPYQSVGPPRPPQGRYPY